MHFVDQRHPVSAGFVSWEVTTSSGFGELVMPPVGRGTGSLRAPCPPPQPCVPAGWWVLPPGSQRVHRHQGARLLQTPLGTSLLRRRPGSP